MARRTENGERRTERPTSGRQRSRCASGVSRSVLYVLPRRLRLPEWETAVKPIRGRLPPTGQGALTRPGEQRTERAGAKRQPFHGHRERRTERPCGRRTRVVCQGFSVSSPPEAAVRAFTSVAPPSFQTSKLPSFQSPLHPRHVCDVPEGRTSRRYRRFRRCRSARKRATDEAGDSKPSFSTLNFHFVLFAGLCALAVEGLAFQACTGCRAASGLIAAKGGGSGSNLRGSSKPPNF